VALYLVALAVALLVGFCVPHPFGLIVLSTVALGAVWRLGERVSRLEDIVRHRLGVSLEEGPYRSGQIYEAEQARVRARIEQYAEEARGERR